MPTQAIALEVFGRTMVSHTASDTAVATPANSMRCRDVVRYSEKEAWDTRVYGGVREKVERKELSGSARVQTYTADSSQSVAPEVLGD